MTLALTSIKDLSTVLSTGSVDALTKVIQALTNIAAEVATEKAKELSKDLLDRLDLFNKEYTKTTEQKTAVTEAKQLVESSYAEKQQSLEQYMSACALLHGEAESVLARLSAHNASDVELKKLIDTIAALDEQVEGLECSIESAKGLLVKAETDLEAKTSALATLSQKSEALKKEVADNASATATLDESILRKTKAIEKLQKSPADTSNAAQLARLKEGLEQDAAQRKELVAKRLILDAQLVTLDKELKVAQQNHDRSLAAKDAIIKDTSEFNETLSSVRSSLATAKVKQVEVTAEHATNTERLEHSRTEAAKWHARALTAETPALAAHKAHDSACYAALSKYGAGVVETIGTGVSSLFSYGYSCLPSLRASAAPAAAATTLTAPAAQSTAVVNEGSETVPNANPTAETTPDAPAEVAAAAGVAEDAEVAAEQEGRKSPRLAA